MSFSRSGGILLHITSLPGPYGIGDIGPQAFRFVDFLAESRCKLWQVLPLGPTGYGDSPYQCFSAMAGNPYIISPELLAQDGFLSESDLARKPDFPTDRVDFGKLIPWKLSLLARAFEHLQAVPSTWRDDFDQFRKENADWLDDYSLFMALKEAHGGGPWNQWPEDLRKRKEPAMQQARQALSAAIQRFAFYQFMFFRQWSALHLYANQKGLSIIGDIPIFVAYDSSDVWANPELFFLDEDGNPTVVAGVPPDLFSATGQLWGNPLYRWNIHQETGYRWWSKRIRSTLSMIDILRLDHFRGFAGYYEIPAGNATAEHGRWVPGPGPDLFRAFEKNLGNGEASGQGELPIIAEDLGVITPDVIELRETFHLPGMKVLQFAFSGPDNPFLPHLYPKNCVAYTGTHDNNTCNGWLASATEAERRFALDYLNSDGKGFARDMIRAIWSSVAVFAITPMQDVLKLDGSARMNYPSRLGGNWEWRMKKVGQSVGEELKRINYLYLR